MCFVSSSLIYSVVYWVCVCGISNHIVIMIISKMLCKSVICASCFIFSQQQLASFQSLTWFCASQTEIESLLGGVFVFLVLQKDQFNTLITTGIHFSISFHRLWNAPTCIQLVLPLRCVDLKIFGMLGRLWVQGRPSGGALSPPALPWTWKVVGQQHTCTDRMHPSKLWEKLSRSIYLIGQGMLAVALQLPGYYDIFSLWGAGMCGQALGHGSFMAWCLQDTMAHYSFKVKIGLVCVRDSPIKFQILLWPVFPLGCQCLVVISRGYLTWLRLSFQPIVFVCA